MSRIQIERGISFKKFLYSWPVLAILAVMLTGLGFKTFRSWQNYRLAAGEYEKLREKISEIEKNKKAVDENLALLNDEYGRDRVIRGQLDVKKSDEKAIIILDQNERDTKNQERQTVVSFFSRIKDFILNIFRVNNHTRV